MCALFSEWKCAIGWNNTHAVATGLTSDEARRRLTEFGENRIISERRAGALTLFVTQFKSPIILILIGAAILSLFLQDRTDATLILTIVLASGGPWVLAEYSAIDAVARRLFFVRCAEARLDPRFSQQPHFNELC